MQYDTMGAETGLAEKIIGGVTSIFNSWNQTEQERIAADLKKSLNKSSGTVNTDNDITPYIPWIVGGVVGIGVIIFLMKR